MGILNFLKGVPKPNHAKVAAFGSSITEMDQLYFHWIPNTLMFLASEFVGLGLMFLDVRTTMYFVYTVAWHLSGDAQHKDPVFAQSINFISALIALLLLHTTLHIMFSLGRHYVQRMFRQVNTQLGMVQGKTNSLTADFIAALFKAWHNVWPFLTTLVSLGTTISGAITFLNTPKDLYWAAFGACAVFACICYFGGPRVFLQGFHNLAEAIEEFHGQGAQGRFDMKAAHEEATLQFDHEIVLAGKRADLMVHEIRMAELQNKMDSVKMIAAPQQKP